MNTSNMPKRIAWIDIMKGGLFILVVLSHFSNMPEWLLKFVNFFSPFRMPGYFFLSGLLFSTKRLNNYSLYLRSKTRTLLLPYLSLSILFLLLDWNIYQEGFEYSLDELYKILILGISSSKSAPLWFVLTLYLICCIYYPIHNLINKKNNWLFFSLFFILISILINRFDISLPLKLGTVFTALPFFIIGVHSKKYIMKLLNLSILIKISILIVSFIAYSILNQHCNGGILATNQIHNYFYFYLLAFLGIFWSIIFCSEISKKKNFATGILENVSRNALIILASHCYFIIIISRILQNLSDNQNIYFLTNFILLIVLEIITIAIFSKYLYFVIGKKRLTFKESLSIRNE